MPISQYHPLLALLKPAATVRFSCGKKNSIFGIITQFLILRNKNPNLISWDFVYSFSKYSITSLAFGFENHLISLSRRNQVIWRLA